MINRETEAIWEENTDTIFYIGKDFKQEKSLAISKDFGNVRKSIFNFYQLKTTVYSLYCNLASKNLLSLIDKLDEDETIIWDFHKSNFQDICIYFCNEDKVSEILPAVMCPSFWKTSALLNYRKRERINEIITKELSTKSVMIELRKKKISLYSVFSPTLRIAERNNWRSRVSELTKTMNKLWQITNCVCKPTKLQVDTIFCVNEDKILNNLSWIDNINDAQFNINILSNSKKIVFDNIFKRIPKVNLNFYIDLRLGGIECLLTGELFSIIFFENIWNFTYKNDKENIKIKARDIVISKNKEWIALKISWLYLQNINLIKNNHDSLANNEFQNEIKDLTKLKKSAYIIVENKKMSLEFNIKYINDAKGFIKYSSMAKIELEEEMKLEDVLEKIDRLPKNVEYIFEIPDAESKSLELLKENRFIKMMKRIKGKIRWEDVNIEIKKLNDKEIECLREKIENFGR